MSREQHISSFSSILALLALSVLGFVPSVSSLRARPESGTTESHHSSALDQVFLWDDPLPSPSVHNSSTTVRASLTGFIPLIVGIRSGQRPEEVETRLRTRHALVRALLAKGYESEGLTRRQHLSFEREAPRVATGLEVNILEAAHRRALSADLSAPLHLPVEIFVPIEVGECRHPGIVVLWLDEAELVATDASQRLQLAASALGHAVSREDQSHPRVPYLGPTSSDVLAAMLESCRANPMESEQLRSRVQLLLTSSTVDGVQKAAKELLCADALVEGDDSLFLMMVHDWIERDLCRDADSSAADAQATGVLLFAEGDSTYGRDWIQRFQQPGKRYLVDRKVENHLWHGFQELEAARIRSVLEGWSTGSVAHESRVNVTTIPYLRGLDGREHAGNLSSGKGEGSSRITPASSGTHQFDYVVNEIRELRRRVLFCEAADPRIVVLAGADIYDKLSLLRVLRTELPRAVVYTTDLDSRYLSPEEISTARNVVLISHQSLSLGAQSAERFRDEYQRALYLGASRIVSGWTDGGLQPESPPYCGSLRAAEVGRTRFVECESRTYGCAPGTLQTGYARTPLRERLLKHWWILMIAICALLAIAMIFLNQEKHRSLGITEFVASTAVASASIVLILVFLSSEPEQKLGAKEPFDLIEGVSVWPTIFLLGLACLVALIGFYCIHRNSVASMREVREEFLSRIELKSKAINNAWDRFAPPRWTPASQGLAIGSAAFLVYCFCVGLAVWLFDDQLGIARGHRAASALFGTTLAVTLGIGLLLSLLTAQMDSFSGLAKELAGHCHVPGTGSSSSRPPENAASVAEIEASFLALVAHSKRIALHVYVPLLVVAIHLFSQYSIFDRFGGSPQSLVIYGLVAMWLVLLTLSFHRRASELRTAITRRIGEDLKRPGAASEEKSTIEATLQRVQQTRDGVFAPLLEAPLFRAVMIPSSSLGVPALLGLFGVQ